MFLKKNKKYYGRATHRYKRFDGFFDIKTVYTTHRWKYQICPVRTRLENTLVLRWLVICTGGQEENRVPAGNPKINLKS